MPTASIQVSDLLKIGTPSFQALVGGDPNLQTEWQHIVSHILADYNAGIVKDARSQVTQASLQLEASMENFASSVTSGDAGKAIDASVQLVSCNWTSSGAAQVIGGLAQMGVHAGADAATPIVQDAAKAMTGSLVSSVISGVAGAAAATGVGAAIGVGVSLVSGLLGSLFGGPPPPPYQIGGCGLQDKPNIVSKYAWTYGLTVDGGPGNPNWRHFPERANKGDAVWYMQRPPPKMTGLNTFMAFGPHQVQWDWAGSVRGHSDVWYGCFTYPGDSMKRAIDQAVYDIGTDGNYANAAEVSVWRHLEQEMLVPINGVPASQMTAFRRFQTAFQAAFKKNREFGFNGCKQQPDWKVLEKTVAMWNQANGPQSTLRVSPVNVSLLPDDGRTATPKTMGSYIQWLLSQYNTRFGMPLQNDGSFLLNTGKINDITVGGLVGLPAGSIHLLSIHVAKMPAPVILPKLKAIGVSPAGIAQLQAVAAARNVPPPKKRYFFGATLAGAATGAVAASLPGALVGAGAGVAVDLLRANHAEKGKWL